MFGTSRLARGAHVPKFEDDTFEMGSRSFSSDGTSSDSSTAEDTSELSEPVPRMSLAAIPPPTRASDAPPIDAPQNKRKFTGTASSPSRFSLSLASLFMRPRKQRQSSTSSLSSVDSNGYQL